MERLAVDGEVLQRRREVRLQASRRETPTFIIWMGIAMVVIVVANFLIPPTESWTSYARTAALGVAYSVTGLIMRRPWFPAPAIPWVFASGAVLLAALFLLDFRTDARPANLAWIVVVLLVLGPATEAVRPFAVAGAVIVAGAAWTLSALGIAGVTGWLIVYLASLVAGGVLLRSRLRTLDALADARLLAERRATTDRLTGLLNRHGLDDRFPGLRALAARQDLPVFVCFVDVRGLKAANDTYGHEFGDVVIRSVADGILTVVREGDLVTRWGGDEFLVVGMGTEPVPDEIEARVHEFVKVSGVDLTRWPGYVTAGCASAKATAAALDALVRHADDAMYERRLVAPSATDSTGPADPVGHPQPATVGGTGLIPPA